MMKILLAQSLASDYVFCMYKTKLVTPSTVQMGQMGVVADKLDGLLPSIKDPIQKHGLSRAAETAYDLGRKPL